jgi:hypothetical protein
MALGHEKGELTMGLFGGLKDKKWFQGLMKVAPAIATVAGGPLAGMALQVINSQLGGDKKVNTWDGVGAIIAGGNPDDLLKLKQADQALEVKLKELDIDIMEIGEKSIQGARDMNAQMKDKEADRLSWFVLATFFLLSATVLAGFFYKDFQLAGAAERYVYLLIGLSGSWVTQIINFRFGSSKGSMMKTIELSQALKMYITNGKPPVR